MKLKLPLFITPRENPRRGPRCISGAYGTLGRRPKKRRNLAKNGGKVPFQGTTLSAYKSGMKGSAPGNTLAGEKDLSHLSPWGPSYDRFKRVIVNWCFRIFLGVTYSEYLSWHVANTINSLTAALPLSLDTTPF